MWLVNLSLTINFMYIQLSAIVTLASDSSAGSSLADIVEGMTILWGSMREEREVLEGHISNLRFWMFPQLGSLIQYFPLLLPSGRSVG